VNLRVFQRIAGGFKNFNHCDVAMDTSEDNVNVEGYEYTETVSG